MELVEKVVAFVSSEQAAMYFLVLFAVSEAIAMIPQVQANSVFQAIFGAMKWVKERLLKK